jgi:glycine cleavage system regulatory protein
VVNSSYIITFIADDRPGLVEQLASVIKQHEGNWQESRLSQLGGKFAGLILVSLPAEHAPALQGDLGALHPGCLSVSVAATGEQAAQASGSRITLSVIGPDRQGIVQEISRVLARAQINVTELDSTVSSAPMSAEMIFSAVIHASIPEGTDLDGLRDTLETIAEDMTLEIDLERVD